MKKVPLRAIYFLSVVCILGVAGYFSAIAGPANRIAARCHNYDPNPECTGRERNALHKLFGLPSLARMHRKRGKGELIVGFVRYKSGGGLALVFQRDRDGTPSVEVRSMRKGSRKSGAVLTLTTKIAEATWGSILAKGAELAPVFARDQVYVCGASFMIELVDASGGVRAPVGDACGNEPRSVYFDDLAQAAIAHLPQCAKLSHSSYDTATERLENCIAVGQREASQTTQYPTAVQGIWFTDNAVGRELCTGYLAARGSNDDEAVAQLVGAEVIQGNIWHSFAEYGEGNFYFLRNLQKLGEQKWRAKTDVGIDSDVEAEGMAEAMMLFRLVDQKLVFQVQGPDEQSNAMTPESEQAGYGRCAKFPRDFKRAG